MEGLIFGILRYNILLNYILIIIIIIIIILFI